MEKRFCCGCKMHVLWTTSPGFFCSQGAAVGRRLGGKISSPAGPDALGCRVYPVLEGRKGTGRGLLWQWWEVGSEASDLPDPFIPDSLFLVPLAHKAGPLLLDLRGWEQWRPSYGCLSQGAQGGKLGRPGREACEEMSLQGITLLSSNLLRSTKMIPFAP